MRGDFWWSLVFSGEHSDEGHGSSFTRVFMELSHHFSCWVLSYYLIPFSFPLCFESWWFRFTEVVRFKVLYPFISISILLASIHDELASLRLCDWEIWGSIELDFHRSSVVGDFFCPFLLWVSPCRRSSYQLWRLVLLWVGLHIEFIFFPASTLVSGVIGFFRSVFLIPLRRCRRWFSGAVGVLCCSQFEDWFDSGFHLWRIPLCDRTCFCYSETGCICWDIVLWSIPDRSSAAAEFDRLRWRAVLLVLLLGYLWLFGFVLGVWIFSSLFWW